MLKKKSEVLQIRLEIELLNRFKLMAEERGVPLSAMLRGYMINICDQYDESKRRKLDFQKRQKEQKR